MDLRKFMFVLLYPFCSPRLQELPKQVFWIFWNVWIMLALPAIWLGW
jgi:hypothetical protein